MKHKLLLAVALLLSIVSFSQNPVKASNSKEKTLEEKMAGTYVIINNDKKHSPVFTTDILSEIEKRRDADKEILWEYNESVTIKILPRRIINASDFDPEKTY